MGPLDDSTSTSTSDESKTGGFGKFVSSIFDGAADYFGTKTTVAGDVAKNQAWANALGNGLVWLGLAWLGVQIFKAFFGKK